MNLFNTIPNNNFVWRLLLTFCFISLIIASSDIAYASGTTTPDTIIGPTFCNIAAILQGNIAKAFAFIGIAFLGFGLFTGKTSWPVAIPIVIGIIVIFKGPDIVALISGNSQNAVCPTQ